jgi:hypothetical protein
VLYIALAIIVPCVTAPVATTEYYSIRKNADGYFLRLYEPPVRETLPEGIFISYRSWIDFSSLKEMKTSILTGDFYESEQLILTHMGMDEKGQIELFDLDNMYAPIMPEEITYKVRWYGKQYSFPIYSPTKDYQTGRLERTTKEHFDRAEETLRYDLKYQDDTDIRETPLKDRNGTCYEYEKNLYGEAYPEGRLTWQVQLLIYRLETDRRTMIVKEKYKIDEDGKRVVEVVFYAEENGVYFYGRLEDPKEVTDQWLLSFGIQPYTGS